MTRFFAIFLAAFFVLSYVSHGQAKLAADSIPAKAKPAPYKPGFREIFLRKDTTKPYSPRIAILRSAVLPGWGQITNKKYWKLPLVYGALGITAGVFFHNVKQYREARAAYINATDKDTSNDYQIPEPYHSVLSNPDRIRTFRVQVRQNVDYSVLFFIAFWGLNVADAAVDAHLKTFDVSDNLSLNIKAGYSPMAQTKGISLVLNIGKTVK
jgi:hypothetical protein